MEWCRVTRHPQILDGFTSCQWTPWIWGVTKILCFKPRVWKGERIGKLMRTSNAHEGEACLVTKCVGSAHFLICL